jgi:hypothetical protein
VDRRNEGEQPVYAIKRRVNHHGFIVRHGVQQFGLLYVYLRGLGLEGLIHDRMISLVFKPFARRGARSVQRAGTTRGIAQARPASRGVTCKEEKEINKVKKKKNYLAPTNL